MATQIPTATEHAGSMGLEAKKEQGGSSALSVVSWPGYDKIPPQVPVEKAYFGAARIVSALIDFSEELSGRFRTAGLLPVQWAESLLRKAIGALRLNYNALLGVMMCNVDNASRQTDSVHTALFSMLAGCQWGLPIKTVCDLGLAELFCDFSMTASAEVAVGPHRREAEERAVDCECPLARMEYLERRAFDPGVGQAIVEQRERGDGTGLPAGCSGKHSSLAGKILTVARAYNALISFSPDRGPLPPHQALALMRGAGGSTFDEQVLEHFIRCLGVYPVGGVVETHCGQRGLVIENNPDMPQLLTVRLLRPNRERAVFGRETMRDWQAERIARAYPIFAPA